MLVEKEHKWKYLSNFEHQNIHWMMLLLQEISLQGARQANIQIFLWTLIFFICCALFDIITAGFLLILGQVWESVTDWHISPRQQQKQHFIQALVDKFRIISSLYAILGNIFRWQEQTREKWINSECMFVMQKESIPLYPSISSHNSNEDFIAGIPGN